MAKKRRRRRRRNEELTGQTIHVPAGRIPAQLSPSPRSATQRISELPSHRTARPLRRAAILEAQRQHGNVYVRDVLSSMTGPELRTSLQVQRALSKEERAKDLESPRFATDSTLQDAYDNSPALRRGDKGEPVKKVQQALIDDGFPMPVSTKKSGEPDGIFGRETYKVVREFQSTYGIGVDGVVGRDTLGKLDELFGRAAAPKTSPKEDPEIAASEEDLGKHNVEKMNEANKNRPDAGIWYSHVRRAWHESEPDKYSWNEDWDQGYADPAYWVRIGFYTWILRPGVSASEGIKAWLKGLTIAECASTMTAIEIDTIRAAVGDKKFDENFGSTDKVVPPQKRLRVSTFLSETPLASFEKSTEAAKKGDAGTKGNRPAKVGEWYYFTNHPKYLLKHPAGAFQGENAFYMGKNPAGQQIWSGLGVSNVNEDAMLLEMAKAYNLDRTEQDYESIVKYRTIRSIPRPNAEHPTYKDLYFAYLGRVQEEYRHDKGHFKDSISADEILSAPPYTIDGDERKGGFLVSVGTKLDEEKIKKLRES